jgi:hypothetical protein
MALYKYSQFIGHSDHASFDGTHKPGQLTPHSAIYRCTGCGKEIVSETNKPFPPQNHHQHTNAMVPILWQMIVFAVSDPK